MHAGLVSRCLAPFVKPRPHASPHGGPPHYAELHALTSFSFQRGASLPEELVERAHALGYAALAITDECSVAGVVRAHERAVKLGLKLIVGSEFRLDADAGLRLIALARDEAAWGDLCEFITAARRRAAKGTYLIDGLGGTHDTGRPEGRRPEKNDKPGNRRGHGFSPAAPLRTDPRAGPWRH